MVKGLGSRVGLLLLFFFWCVCVCVVGVMVSLKLLLDVYRFFLVGFFPSCVRFFWLRRP